MHDDLVRSLSMEGRVSVVTGGGSGIGRASAVVLAEAGANVVVCDLDEGGMAETVRLVEERGARALAIRVDVASRSEVDALADKAVERFGRIDAWVNCAGVIIPKGVVDVIEADVDFQVAVNMKGVLWGCQAAARIMARNGGGSIVNISSTGGDQASPGISVYSMTKAAVNALTRACALEFGPSGIRVNGVGPGFTLTPMTSVAREPDPKRREEMIAALKKNPLGMIADPRDQALTVLYLASDASRFVTGQTVRPNGGACMS